MKAYTIADLDVLDDAVATIRGKRAIYLPTTFPGPYLAARLVHDLALLDATPVSVDRDGTWWMISAAADWLRTPSGQPSTQPFFRIVPCPAWGAHSFRSEVLLTAFAAAVFTAAFGQIERISGHVQPGDLPANVATSMARADVARVVAFWLPDAAATPRA